MLRQSLLAVLCGAALLALPTPAFASAEPCPNEQLRVENNSTALPDCRAYELVSTGVQSDVDPIVYREQSEAGRSVFVPALSGGEVLWDSPFATPGSNSGDLSTWLSARQAPGWAQTPAPLTPPGVDPSDSFVEIAAVTPDLSHVLLISFEALASLANPGDADSSGGHAQYDLRNPDGSYTTVATTETEAALGAHFIYGAEGFSKTNGALAELSEDGSHVYFEAHGQFAGDTHTEDTEGACLTSAGACTDQLYEWSNGHLQVAALDSAGEELSACGAILGNWVERPSASTSDVGANGHIAGAVSQDGSRVFFESPDPHPKLSEEVLLRKGLTPPPASPACQQPTDLYVRENGQTTIDISAPPPGVTDRGDARFVGATPDGSRVFFTSPTQLTPSKTDTDPDLYEYDIERHALTRLSVGPPGYDDANVQSALASSDGSHVYFIATGQLVPPDGTPGQPNLYVYENGAVHFIATVSPALNLNNETGSFTALETGYEPDDAAFVTPSGADLVFEDTSTLTTYHNNGADEIYRYDAPTGQIACVSCDPAGAPPTPVPVLPGVGPAATLLGPAAVNAKPVGTMTVPNISFGRRVISEDGRMVFFTSREPLLPAAENTSAGACEAPFTRVGCVENVYEWNEGSLSLISSGKSPLFSQLLGASASGSNVFFTTFAPLVSQDAGQFNEIYDARIGGGFPAPSSPAPCGSLEACRGASSTTPSALAAPASASFAGPGNPTPPAPSSSEPAEAPTPKPLTSAQKLSKALKVCKKDKSKSKRLACERSARKKYAPSHKAKKSAKRGGRS